MRSTRKEPGRIIRVMKAAPPAATTKATVRSTQRLRKSTRRSDLERTIAVSSAARTASDSPSLMRVTISRRTLLVASPE